MLMPKDNPWGHHDWVGRDYTHIDCMAVGCVYNVNHSCGAPSRCKLGKDGKCEGFVAQDWSKKKYEGD